MKKQERKSLGKRGDIQNLDAEESHVVIICRVD
jgi:hypothetical protein